MSPGSLPKSLQEAPGPGLAGVYTRVTVWYLLAVWLLWSLGIEGIYGHPFPFYALISPVFTSTTGPALVLGLILLAGATAATTISRPSKLLPVLAALSLAIGAASFIVDIFRAQALSEALDPLRPLPWYVFGVTLLTLAVILLSRVMRKLDWYGAGPNRVETRWILLGLAIFAFAFPASIAMLRDGPLGISQAYDRQAYEYIKDIGLGGSIRGLFKDYITLHPYLSMHAQVHPPGPIVILWLFSYGVGQSPMGLSLATMAFGALSVFPMYLWARELFCRRTALTCTVLYTLIPSIVIFTATSADITFIPFTLLTLFLFQRAIERSSIVCALTAGVSYGMLSLISFSLISIGIYFALIGLLRLAKPDTRRAVFQTAALMIVGLLALHGAIWLWSGFDIVEVFQITKQKFDSDQRLLDVYDPRFPSWAWKIGNPACWFFFAGIPVSVLFIWRLWRTKDNTRWLFYAFGAALVAFDILYLARGEGERSGMYIMPFLAIPAGHLLDEFGATARSPVPLAITAAFLGLQSLAIESILYTYW